MNGISLTRLLWFLAIGFLFYWMMKKGGCGAHAHGGHGQHGGDTRERDTGLRTGNGGAAMSTTKDPVCGMGLDPSAAVAVREHMGETFYFCSTDCAEKFDQNPMQYMAEARQEGNRENVGRRHQGC